MKSNFKNVYIKWKFLGITLILIFLILIIFFIGLIIDNYISQNDNSNKPQFDEFLILYSRNNEFFIGNPNSNLTIVEFFDPNSPFCEKYYKKIYEQIYQNYIKTGKVKYVFKYFPQQIHKNSFNTSLAIECAREQLNGIKYKDKVLELKNKDIVSLKNLAKDLNLSLIKFNDCLDSRKYENIIYANIEEAKILDIKVTPTLIINNQKIEGLKPYSYYKKIIENNLD